MPERGRSEPDGGRGSRQRFLRPDWEQKKKAETKAELANTHRVVWGGAKVCELRMRTGLRHASWWPAELPARQTPVI
jgi:hypothetical protein